jgi:LuxR family transcriptional regulator, maltose regulon positive regulatory protein
MRISVEDTLDNPNGGTGARHDAAPLLRTKLHRPTGAPGLEKRTRLLQRLGGHGQRALTLIAAPAGYGKTTLASVWLEGLDTPSAWVSLDERDDDLLTFATYLVAAARGAFPSQPFRTQALLQAPVPPAPSVIARYLADDLEQTGSRLTLALDDIHSVRDPAIFDLLAELLRHPLPSLHLLLIGRRDPPLPVAAFRARGEVVEIRARDLQFTPAETARLLGQMLGREVDDATATLWTERTEGWVTALRLAALALLQRYGEELKLAAFASPHFVQEYLLADVLAHLPAATRSWLLKTAILDRFCAPLCEAVCGDKTECASGMSGKTFLRWLREENLFLVSLDDHDRWFRFHHLFQELLLDLMADQLSLEEIQAVHRRASAWFAAHRLPDDAIQQALAGDDLAAAARVVEDGRYELMNTEQWTRLDRWLRLLPPDLVAGNVLLSNARGFLAIQRGEEIETKAALQRAAHLVPALPPDGEAARIALAELGALNYLPDFQAGRFAVAVANARRSFETLPKNALHIRSLAKSIEASALHLGGAPAEALETLNNALADPFWPPPLRARLLYYLCTEHYLSGNLRAVLASAAECVAIAVEMQLPELASWGLYYLGAAHYARNDFAAAEPHFISLLEHRALANPVTLSFGVFALALIRLAQERADEAVELIESLAAYLRKIEHWLASLLIDTFKTELALRQGCPVEAPPTFAPGLAARLPRWYFYAPHLTDIKLLLASGAAESRVQAHRLLDAFEDEVRRFGVTHTLIDVLALRALTLAADGNETAALDRLSEAIKLAEKGGFICSFLDLGAPMLKLLTSLPAAGNNGHVSPHLHRVVSAFPAVPAATPPPHPTPPGPPAARLVEPLTEREEQLLRLVATELSPVEIAERLCLSPTTVRTHIRNIYGKLDAHSRFEAVVRARELGFL